MLYLTSLSKFFPHFCSVQKPLFFRLGGESTIFEVIESFYDQIQSDPVLFKYFRNSASKKIVEHQKRVVLISYGGNPCLSEKEIKKAHATLKISNADFDLMKNLLKNSLEGVEFAEKNEVSATEIKKFDENTISEALTFFESYRKITVVETPYQLLGGKEGLKQIIDYQFEKILIDPELRHFFLSADIKRLKAKIVIYLGGMLGGPDQYEGQDMKNAHKALEINDRHFFLMKKHLAWGMHKCNINNAIIDKALDVIEKDRNNILESKTTYEELGEDIGLQEICELLFAKVKKNPMLRGFFHLSNIERTTRCFYHFLARELGGPQKNGNFRDLKQVHSKFNLLDVHLDAFQNCIEAVLKHKLVDPMVIRDVLWTLERFRREVCTVTMYDLVGGEKFIEKGSIILQKKVKFHYKLAHFFTNYSDDQVVQLMRHLLTYSVGGRRAFRGRDMKNAHEELAIKEEHFNDMKSLVRDTFRECGVVDTLIVQVLRVYDDKKRYVVSKQIIKKENYDMND